MLTYVTALILLELSAIILQIKQGRNSLILFLLHFHNILMKAVTTAKNCISIELPKPLQNVLYKENQDVIGFTVRKYYVMQEEMLKEAEKTRQWTLRMKI